MKSEFQHIWIPGTAEGSSLLLLHGTGGSENDLLPLGRELLPDAAILSPLGQVREHGAPRFFRRFGEGQLDVDDWRFRANELADFLQAADGKYAIDPARRIAVGYSNGANIALGLLLLRPEVLGAAILFRPMFVTDEVLPNRAKAHHVLILSGSDDPLMRPGEPQRISRQLEENGASVKVNIVPGGHGLTSEDLRIAKAWLAERR